MQVVEPTTCRSSRSRLSSWSSISRPPPRLNGAWRQIWPCWGAVPRHALKVSRQRHH